MHAYAFTAANLSSGLLQFHAVFLVLLWGQRVLIEKRKVVDRIDNGPLRKKEEG